MSSGLQDGVLPAVTRRHPSGRRHGGFDLRGCQLENCLDTRRNRPGVAPLDCGSLTTHAPLLKVYCLIGTIPGAGSSGILRRRRADTKTSLPEAAVMPNLRATLWFRVRSSGARLPIGRCTTATHESSEHFFQETCLVHTRQVVVPLRRASRCGSRHSTSGVAEDVAGDGCLARRRAVCHVLRSLAVAGSEFRPLVAGSWPPCHTRSGAAYAGRPRKAAQRATHNASHTDEEGRQVIVWVVQGPSLPVTCLNASLSFHEIGSAATTNDFSEVAVRKARYSRVLRFLESLWPFCREAMLLLDLPTYRYQRTEPSNSFTKLM